MHGSSKRRFSATMILFGYYIASYLHYTASLCILQVELPTKFRNLLIDRTASTPEPLLQTNILADTAQHCIAPQQP